MEKSPLDLWAKCLKGRQHESWTRKRINQGLQPLPWEWAPSQRAVSEPSLAHRVRRVHDPMWLWVKTHGIPFWGTMAEKNGWNHPAEKKYRVGNWDPGSSFSSSSLGSSRAAPMASTVPSNYGPQFHWTLTRPPLRSGASSLQSGRKKAKPTAALESLSLLAVCTLVEHPHIPRQLLCTPSRVKEMIQAARLHEPRQSCPAQHSALHHIMKRHKGNSQKCKHNTKRP